MSTKPSLILTRLDVQRLERLIDSLDESTPGVLALQNELDRAEQVVGHEVVEAAGGTVVLVDILQGFSTTALVHRARGGGT